MPGLIDIPPGEQGRAYARALALYSYALYKWSLAHDSSPMRAVAFDKLVTLVSRLWDELYTSNNGKITSFPIPFVSLRGKHGPGRGVRTRTEDKGALYVGTIFSFLADIGLPWLMRVDRPLIGKSREMAPPSNPRTRFKSGLILPETVMFGGPRGGVFSSGDWAVVCEITNIVACLSEEEIRYLGTHSTAEQTLHAVVFELDHWDAHCSKLLDSLAKGKVSGRQERRSLEASAKEAAEYAREALKKCTLNEPLYSAGRSRFLAAEQLRGPVKEAFEKTQDEPSLIWQEGELPKFKKGVEMLSDLSLYLGGVVAVCGLEVTGAGPNGSVEKAAKAKKELDQDLSEHGCCLPAINSWSAKEGLDGALSDLVRSCETIKGRLPWRPDRSRCRQAGNAYRGHVGVYFEGYAEHAW